MNGTNRACVTTTADRSEHARNVYTKCDAGNSKGAMTINLYIHLSDGIVFGVNE
ncbi:hypothetical protein DPPLL_09240 [Desulfofustis limnaeus]|uniref:Uncharacterized protein n=1 Tax=Desulfofustis limnaeus TaxID=2740163 RepID=A0ABN6M3G8_9BACT|nr:hypothetical protein DPPLL_09240 [Desulfofustis limnaeus]